MREAAGQPLRCPACNGEAEKIIRLYSVSSPAVAVPPQPVLSEKAAGKRPIVAHSPASGVASGIEECVMCLEEPDDGMTAVVPCGHRCLCSTCAALLQSKAEACGKPLRSLDCSCFDGQYVTSAAVGDDYLHKLASKRSSDRGGDGDGPSPMHLLDRLEIPKKARRA